MKISPIGCTLLALCLGACGGPKESPDEKEKNATAALNPWPDFSNQETLDAILAEAIDRDTLQESDGRFLSPDSRAPYDGWGKGLYPTGKTALLDRYKNGKLDGQTFWFPNGQKKREGRFRNGNQEGVWVEWNEDGTERQRVTFSKGIPVE